jgi:predicted PurR-regulated permease PerM
MGDRVPQRASPEQEGEGVRPMVLFRRGFYTSLGVLVTAAAGAAVYLARDVLIRALIALFLAISLDTIVRLLTRWRMSRGLAVVVVLLVMVISVAGFLSAVIPTIVEQLHTLVKNGPSYVANWQNRSASLHRVSDKFHLTPQIDSAVKVLPTRFGHGLFGATGRVLSGILSTLTVGVLTVYFLADLPRLRRGGAKLAPRDYRDRLSRIVDVTVDKVGAYTVGNIVVSLIAGLAAFAALTALRIPLALALAFLVALTDLIPSIGATLGAVICLLVALPTTHLWPNVVLLAVFFVVYQMLENYVIAPRVMHGSVQLRAGAVLLATLIGGSALGVVGALMAIPIAAAAQQLLSERIQTRDADTHPPPASDGENEQPSDQRPKRSLRWRRRPPGRRQ